MSDMLTHWASFEDCRRLAQLDDSLAPELRVAIDKDQHFARLGTLSFGGNTWMEPLLRSARTHWQDPDRPAKYERNLAYVLGGLIHQACDRVMKPVLSEFAGQDWSDMHAAMRTADETKKAAIATTQEVSAYVDAEIFRQVYAGGANAPFSRFFMAEVSETGADFEEFVRATFQRSLLASHTLRPDMDDLEGWLDNLFEKVQPLYLDVDLWVKVFNHPDPKKVAQLALDKTFYRQDDPTIRASRLLAQGKPVDAGLREQVFGTRETTCAYAEILQVGLLYLRAGSVFWRGEADNLKAPNYEKGMFQGKAKDEVKAAE